MAQRYKPDELGDRLVAGGWLNERFLDEFIRDASRLGSRINDGDFGWLYRMGGYSRYAMSEADFFEAKRKLF